MIYLNSPKVKKKCILKKAEFAPLDCIQQHLNDTILYIKGVGQEGNFPSKLRKDHQIAALDLVFSIYS